jgi:hypothetical protein
MSNKIDTNTVYDIVPTKVLNLSKVNQLVELGKLKQEDLDKLFKVTFALTVDPSEQLTAQLESVAHAFEAEKVAVTGKPPEPKALSETASKSKKKK